MPDHYFNLFEFVARFSKQYPKISLNVLVFVPYDEEERSISVVESAGDVWIQYSQ